MPFRFESKAILRGGESKGRWEGGMREREREREG